MCQEGWIFVFQAIVQLNPTEMAQHAEVWVAPAVDGVVDGIYVVGDVDHEHPAQSMRDREVVSESGAVASGKTNHEEAAPIERLPSDSSRSISIPPNASRLFPPSFCLGRPLSTSLVFRPCQGLLFSKKIVLHVGITDTAATRVYNFDEGGCVVNDANAAEWSRALSLPLVSDGDVACDQPPATQLDEWDTVLQQHFCEWARKFNTDYNPRSLNCYDYVASAANALGIGGHSTWSRKLLCTCGVDKILRGVELHDVLVGWIQSNKLLQFHSSMAGRCHFLSPSQTAEMSSPRTDSPCVDSSECPICVGRDNVEMGLTTWRSTVIGHDLAPQNEQGEWELEQGEWVE